ncbi:hypothetical protein Slala03_71690 [Streptomyces lavendulae subsp. lavendulae]|nr:hypothetical protein Slala03_71690 [Streptomyces lavendulae subsp. lavendulae]
MCAPTTSWDAHTEADQDHLLHGEWEREKKKYIYIPRRAARAARESARGK